MFHITLACTAWLIAARSTASAQTLASGKWEIELHAGGMRSTNPPGGTVSLPGPGETFTTSGIYPPPAPQVVVVSSSRRESSWYFGDGAVLFNQAAAAVAANPFAMTAAFAGRIVSLDPVLGRSLLEGRAGASVGARVSRVLTPRVSAELSVDYGLAHPKIAQANRDALEATRVSFIAAFDGLIRSNPTRVLNSLTSTAALDDGTGRQLVTSGVLILNLTTAGRIIPYAAIGASVLTVTGKAATVTLKGNYQYLNPSGSPIDETDSVTVRARDRHTLAGIVGAGVKYQVSPRWGIRFDARTSLSKNAASTQIDAAPSAVLGLLPRGRGTLNADPTLQFSNNWTDPITTLGVTSVAISTLSGPAINGFRTFSGKGVSSHTSVSAGLFWRF
jgi:hypothetical protein